MYFLLILLTISIPLVVFQIIHYKKKKAAITAFIHQDFPENWKKILAKNIPFYKALTEKEKQTFESWILRFLAEKTITPIKTTITDEDKLFVAASAIIPVFAFPFYLYPNLKEVLIYPNSFNSDYDLEGPDRNILGMVGSGVMEGKMILDKNALEQSFQNQHDKQCVSIHEFVHLIDKLDGSTDGIPDFLLEHKLVAPWLEIIKNETKAIFENKSDINPYAVTNNAEFLAVVSEYFFKNPKSLQAKHPELYKELCLIFKQTPDWN